MSGTDEIMRSVMKTAQKILRERPDLGIKPGSSTNQAEASGVVRGHSWGISASRWFKRSC
jgi:hypothetical protein